MGSKAMITKSAPVHTKGFTLIASLLLLLLLSGIAIGLMMMVNTEGKVGGNDLQNNLAFHAAEGGIEKMASDLNATFQNAQTPTAAQICAVSGTSYQPVMTGVTWKQYSVMPGSSQSTSCPSTLTGLANWGQISSGPDSGLWAQIIPVNMLATAAFAGGQEVSMSRQAQVALIPVFQFGVFCEGDCSFFSTPSLTFAGRVHTNADLYLGVSNSASLTFNNKLEAYGNVVTEVIPNGLASTSSNDVGNVYIPTTNNGCSSTTPTLVNCLLKDANGSATYGDGSVTGAGSSTAQTSATYNTSNWNAFSKSSNYMIINGNYGSASVPGTGAKKLSMPFVNGTKHPYEIIRRTLSTDSTALSESREYNMAQIHVLLSDDPAELPGGASDTNNVRLANIPANSSGTGYNLPYGITMTSGNYTSAVAAPASGHTYNQYFATATNAIPDAGCTSSTVTCVPDWPYPPAPWTAAMMAAVGAGTDSNCTLLCPTGAPYVSGYSATTGVPTLGLSPALSGAGASTVTRPTFTPCPPASPAAASLPANCPSTAPPYPYYAVSSVSSASPAPLNAAKYPTATWNLIDGWLRVEYEDSSGNWNPVTNEWLSLGFARGLTAPTLPGSSAPAAGTNPVNPNAILILQEPADRVTSGNLPASVSSTGTAPTCTTTSGGKCTAWSFTSPQVLVDTAGNGIWQYGITTTAQNSAPGSSTLQTQSVTRFNWYPINFYDAREGEPRDIIWSSTTASDNTCTANGIMNAVEIDVGNLKRWLTGAIGTSGTSVNTTEQNGYVLYFSDRRGMLPNPIVNGTSFTKSGDSGLEDVINANGSGDSATGTPDGVLEPIATGQTYSPEDVAQLGNGQIENFGTDNLGLGFYGTAASSSSTNLNYLIVAANPNDPYGTASYNSRITSCGSARKNWVSGARHVLKLVDGSLGNVPNVAGGTLTDPGGFTVSSENPVYIQGNYNSNSTDTFFSAATSTGPGPDISGHSSAAVIADAVSILSNNWVDQYSTLGNNGFTATGGSVGNYSPTQPAGNRPAATTYYRVAIAGGKNLAFPFPSWANASSDYPFGTDGGTGNFLRFLEDWGTTGPATLNYGGSLVSLFYATYGTGIFKCCTYSVYRPPIRNYIFDTDFTLPEGLPPGTPMFRDVETLSYRQLFTTRTSSQ